MNLRFPFFLVVFAVLSVSASAQNAVDSLQTALRNHPQKDSVRVNLLNKIATKLFTSDGDQALKLLRESETIATDLSYAKDKAYSQLFTGNILFNRADYKNALSNFSEAFHTYKNLGDQQGQANCRFNFGRTYYATGDYPKAEEHFKAAIALCGETGDQKRLSASLIGIGTLYSHQGDFEESMEAFQKAAKIDEKIGNKRGVANSLTAIGNIYRKQARFPLAIEHYRKSYDIKEKLGDPLGMAVNLANIGITYEELDQDQEAMDQYEKALAIFERIKSKKEVLSTLTNIGVIQMNHHKPEAGQTFGRALELSRELGLKFEQATLLANLGTLDYIGKNYKSALGNLEKAAQLQQELGNKRELSYAYLKIGQTYFGLKDYEKALEFADKGSAQAKSMHILDYQSDFAKLQSEIYYATKDYKLAYEKSEAHKALNDSIFKKENIAEVAEVKYRYQYKDSLDTANRTVLKKDSEIASTNVQKWWWIAGFVGLLVVLGGVLAYVKIRRVKMENKQLLTEQKLLRSQMNPHFIFNSLQNVRSLIHNGQHEEAMRYLTQFSKLTRQILESSDVNYISLEEELQMIRNYIAVQQLLYSSKFEYELSVDDDIDEESTFLPPMLTQPFIENAIKHGLGNKKEGGKIHIRFHLNNGKLFFEVSDNGNGFGASEKVAGHKSMSMQITKDRLVRYTKNEAFELEIGDILDAAKNIIGAKVAFEIPYIYEN